MQQRQTYGGNTCRFSDFHKFDVVDSRGENLGSVDDVMFDLSSGQIHQVFVRAGDFLGLGGKMLAIPFRALDIRGKRLQLHRTKDELMKAPWSEQGQMFTPDYDRTSSTYWGEEWGGPYYSEEQTPRA